LAIAPIRAEKSWLLRTAVRIYREIAVWGTVLLFDVESDNLSNFDLESALAEVSVYVHHVDEVFSTYKNESVISKLRRDEVQIAETPEEVIEVWNLCAELKRITNGAFDPWLVPGGFDPSGLVKGWAADKCAEILLSHSVKHILINAAGDLTLRGGRLENGEIKPWVIGISDPENQENIVKTFEILDGAIATSGDYERGDHIKDPQNGMVAVGAKSATVIGPNGAYADALATALMVAGGDGASWFTQPELEGFKPWVINRHDSTSWSLT
jgi:thiamine biosynthesis lipoprotein